MPIVIDFSTPKEPSGEPSLYQKVSHKLESVVPDVDMFLQRTNNYPPKK